VTPPGIDPGIVRIVAQCLNHYATPAPPLIKRERNIKKKEHSKYIPGVPLATEPGISLILLPLMRILQRNLKRTYLLRIHTTDTFLFISHTTNVILFKLCCSIFICVRIINILKPNDIYMCRTAALTSRRYIFYIYSTNTRTEYFKHAA